jgi:tRNA (guanine9-N1)-methyltransferase
MSELSKSQLKKLKKKEKMLEKKKEKNKTKKKKCKKVNCLHRSDYLEWDKRMKNGLKVVIDCDFDSYQTDKEMTSLKQQLMYCYSLNKRSDFPLNLSVTGISNALLQRLEKLSCSNWEMRIHSEGYIDLFEKEKLVYLTADSSNTIDTFDSESVYIIGGIVDHNRHKLLTYNKASLQNIKTAKLPLAQYVQLQRSSILTVNHMIALMLKFSETQDWRLSIMEAIPSRKIIISD